MVKIIMLIVRLIAPSPGYMVRNWMSNRLHGTERGQGEAKAC